MEKLAVYRYSKALFDIAIEKNAVAEFKSAAADVLAALKQDKDVVAMINHPGIPLDKKINAFQAAFLGKIPEDFVGLFALMLKRGREDDIEGVLLHFDELYKEYSNLGTAILYSSELLSVDKINEIAQILSSKTGKSIQIEQIIEPSLIAGFRVELDGFVFDASIKHQMSQMKKQLLGSY